MMALQIIIAQQGWVFVGDCAREADHVVVRNTRNIRRWGTTAGLGQLSKDGPQLEALARSLA